MMLRVRHHPPPRCDRSPMGACSKFIVKEKVNSAECAQYTWLALHLQPRYYSNTTVSFTTKRQIDR
eukprot:scaffold1570_cov61-Phaeocystis_antarctica.AAC.1